MTLIVHGYAAWFGNEDSVGDIIVPGAFARWISANPGKSLPIFWMHEHAIDPRSVPIGRTDELREDSKGLWFKGLLNDTPRGLEIQEAVSTGSARGSSFAYRVNDRRFEDGVRYLLELEPSEITIANWGVNNRTYVEPVPEEAAA